jgi:hypothetical protein
MRDRDEESDVLHVPESMVEMVKACFAVLAPPGDGDGDNNDDEDAEPKSAAIVCN